MPVDLPALIGHSRNFLAQVGYPTRDYVQGPIDSPLAARNAGLALPGIVDFPGVRSGLESLARRYGTKGGRGRLSSDEVEAARVLLHEGLHQVQWGRNPTLAPGEGGRGSSTDEERATEAATQDLLGIFTSRMFGAKLAPQRARLAAYGPEVHNLRQLSVFGSGAGRFEDRAARVWRRTYQHAEPAERDAMEAKALAAKAAIERQLAHRRGARPARPGGALGPPEAPR